MPVRFGGRAFVFYGELNGGTECGFEIIPIFTTRKIKIACTFSGNFQGARIIVRKVRSGFEPIE
jgi:hypothetical protein